MFHHSGQCFASQCVFTFVSLFPDLHFKQECVFKGQPYLSHNTHTCRHTHAHAGMHTHTHTHAASTVPETPRGLKQADPVEAMRQEPVPVISPVSFLAPIVLFLILISNFVWI